MLIKNNFYSLRHADVEDQKSRIIYSTSSCEGFLNASLSYTCIANPFILHIATQIRANLRNRILIGNPN